MLHILEAKYLCEFRPNLLVFTQLIAEPVCDLKLWLIFLAWNVSYVILFEKFLFTLNNSVASDWMFFWWIVNNFLLLSKSSK